MVLLRLARVTLLFDTNREWIYTNVSMIVAQCKKRASTGYVSSMGPGSMISSCCSYENSWHQTARRKMFHENQQNGKQPDRYSERAFETRRAICVDAKGRYDSSRWRPIAAQRRRAVLDGDIGERVSLVLSVIVASSIGLTPSVRLCSLLSGSASPATTCWPPNSAGSFDTR